MKIEVEQNPSWLKPFTFWTVSAQSLVYEKRILFTKPFHQQSVYEKKILVQNWLHIEWIMDFSRQQVICYDNKLRDLSNNNCSVLVKVSFQICTMAHSTIDSFRWLISLNTLRGHYSYDCTSILSYPIVSITFCNLLE